MNATTKSPPSATSRVNLAAVSEHVMASVRDKLAEIEREHDVQVLYSAESGSRAWGFPSRDSDYDVRFIYLHKPDWYVSLGENRDVIERPIDDTGLDISGWDFRKALRLALNSNPALYEWLVSPVVYKSCVYTVDSMLDLIQHYYSRRAMARHYRSMAVNNQKKYFFGRSEIRLKKYFYSIRPLCALLWLHDREDLPPMGLGTLMAGIELPTAVREAIGALLEQKRTTNEIGTGERLSSLDEWIERGIADSRKICLELPEGDSMVTAADELYRRVILEQKT